MTKHGQETKRKLMQDVESYTCGEIPSPLDLLRAATLERWQIEIRRRGGEEFVMVMRGEVHKHPEIPDGEHIQTSAVVWFDRKDRFVRTQSRVYALCEPAGVEIPIEGIDI
jgi:hypothetical protein